jgi:hypothetical protein
MAIRIAIVKEGQADPALMRVRPQDGSVADFIGCSIGATPER